MYMALLMSSWVRPVFGISDCHLVRLAEATVYVLTEWNTEEVAHGRNTVSLPCPVWYVLYTSQIN